MDQHFLAGNAQRSPLPARLAMPPVHLTMIGPRLSLLITVTLLLTPLCLTDLPHTRHQIPNGRSVSDEEVAITSTIYEEGDGGEGNGANGDGHEQDGILRATARAIWGTLRPYVVAEGIDSFERLVSLKSRLLKEVEDEVTAYTNVTVFTWPDDDFGPEHQTEEVKAATSAGAGENDDSYYSGNDMMRTKREHPVHHPFIRDPFGVAMLDEVETLLSLETEPTLGVYMTQWHGRLIVAGMGVRKIVTLYAVTQRPYKVESTPPFPGVHSCRFTVVPEDILLVACISPVRRKVQHLGIHEELVPEVTVYQVEEEAYGSGKLSTKHLQSIEVDEPVDLEMWSRDGEHYLLIANSKEVNVEYSPSGEVLAHRTNYHSVSYLYKWKEHYFDALQHRVLPGSYPRTVTHFTIGSRHFVAMANYRNNKGQRNIDSFIFHYSLEEDHLVLFQQLPTRGALHIASFTLGHSHFADTFLAVANSCEDEDGGSCNPHTNSAIYQFTGKKFVLFQEVPTLLAVQWLAVQVEGTVLLAVAQMVAGVKLFQYDGWRFVATKIQHYEGSFGPGATGLAAAHWNGTVVLAVSSLEHQDSLFHSLDVFRLTFRKNTRLKAVHSDYEAWCVAALREAKQTELVASLVSGIQAATNQTYVFTSHVTIKGSLTAGLGSFVTQTFERTTSRHLPVLTGGITQLLLTLGSKVQQAVVRISNAVSLSDPISWPGDLHLYDLSAGSASAERLYVHDVNQRVVSWRDAVMLEGIDLQYMARLRLDHVEIKAVTQIANLKGQPFSSFVTLSGHHTIFGHVSFSAAIRVASLIAVTVDKVVITPQYVLIADDSQYLNGSLTCQYLNAVSLEVVTINGVPLSPLLSSLVLKDARSAVNGLVRVMGNLAYHGNLQVNLSLPLDLKNVIKVDYAGLQVVTGGHQVGELAAPSMAIEGRLNNMRVPAEVFLNGSHHSYIVVSAAFSHVRAISVFIFQKLHNLTVTEGRLDVLLLSGYQIVTAPKTFTSLQLLEQNAPNYRSASIRRRRWSSENCELPRNRRPKTLTARIETLFLVLRGVAAAQDLLIFLTEIQPGQFLVPGQNLNFFNLLMQNVDCAILYLENNGNLKLHETLDAIKWHNTTVFIQNELPTDNMTEMIGNIQSYLVQEKLELKKVTLNADDLLLINNLKKADSTRRDLLILDYLIDITSNHELENLPSEIFHRNCLLFCPAFHENIRDRKKMQMSCIPEILTVFKAMKTISKYSAIITEMKQLSAHSYQILKAGVVRYLLGQLLRSVSEKKELRKQVYAAVVCRLSPEGSEEYQQMLITYRRELHQNTSRFIHSRIKRQASEAAYGLTDPEPPSTLPASNSEDTSTIPLSFNEDANENSSTLQDSVIENTSQDSSTLSASTTEATSEDSPTLSVSARKNIAAIPEDTSQDSSAFTVSIIDNNSEDSSALPLSVTEDTSEDSSTLQASVTEDTNEDSSTLPTSITEDTIEDSSTLPASVTDETSGDSSILPASITDETSGDSSIFPASITEDTSGDSSTPPASITEDTSGDPSIFPASITEDTSGDSFTLPVSVTEDTSGDSSTFTAYVTEDTSGDSSILPASVTEDTSGDSSTLPAYVTEDTSGDSSNLLHSVIDNTSEGSSTLLASFIEDTSGDSSTLPPSVIDSTNEGSSTLPTSVTEDTSGDSSTIPSSVIDSTSEGYSTLPASVTEDTSGDSSTLPASITENTSEDSSTLPASITEDTSEDSSTLPASITEDTSGDSSTLPASITEDSSENSSVTPYRREDANEDSSTHTLSIGEINTAFAAATTEFFSSSLDSSTFTGSTNEISFNFSTLAPLSVSPSSMYGDSVFLSARAGLLSELRELETTVAVDSDKTTQILGFQTTDEKTTPEDHVTDSILRLSTTGNAQITGIFADILGLRTTEGTSESMDSVTVDLKGTIDLTAISGSQTVGITGNEIADPETIPEAEKPNFTTDITKTSTTTVTDVTEDSSPNTMTEKATESSVVTDKDITNPFTIVNNNMEVNLSQTDADAILVPLKVSLNYENCSTLPPNLLQDSNRLMYLYRRMQMTDDYFSTVVRLLPELKVPKEPSQYDVGVEGAMLDAFGFLIDTVKKFVLDPIGFLGELDIERLQKDLDFFFFVSSFATSSQYYYWSERLRYRDLYLKTLLEFSGIITRRLLNCFETFYPEFSTSGYETTSHPFAYSDDMPEIVKNMSEEFKTNSALIKNLMILLNFTKNVVALNPYLNKRCPAPHAIDPEGVAIAIEEVRETLGFILEDELMFSKVVNTSFLENQVLILKDNTQMCLMASHLPQEVEASLSQIYEENGSVLAEDAQKLLNIRIKHLQRINLALVDTIVDIADHRAIDSEVSPPEPISAIPDSQTQWNWDGLWLDGRLAGYLLSQLFDEAGLLLSASPHKEYTANFYPAPLSHVNFIEAHKDKVRHLRFLSGLSAPTVQGMGMAQIQRHGLALTATTNIVLTFVASVTVDGPVTVSRVNGIHASSFITLGGHHTLQQPFIFMGSITAAARVRVHNEINGLDLVLLSNSVVLTSSVTRQVLRQPIIFTQVSAQRVVFETGRVQEVDLDDLVTLGHPAIITGRKTFQELIVRENGTVAGAVDARYVGGINVTDLFYNSLIKNPGGLQVVAGRLHLRHLVVLNDVTTHGIVCLDWHGVPGVLDLNSIASRVVLLNGSASITADLVITGSVYVTGLFFRDTLDGVSVALYRDGWILRDTDQSIHGNVSFDNIISHSVIISQGIKVQDVDVTRLYLKTFLTTWPSTLPLPLTFRGHVNAARVEVRGLVQGWDLSKHALLQHSSSTVFTAAKVFLGDVLIAGNLTSTNPGDDCTYFPFLNLTVIGTVVVENIFPTASVFLPDHEITTKTATQYWLADTDTKVSIEIFFDVIVLSHLNAIVTWNNLEMKDFSKSLFEKRCDVVQALAGFYSFSDLEIEESLYTPAINSSSLNGVVSSNLRHVLMADGAQVFTGHPSINNLRAHGSGTVVTSEGVNGLLMSHMCRHAEPCIVHAPKTLVQDFEIMEDLTLPKNSLVQGVDVSRSLHAWVSRNLCGFIPGLTTFTGPFIVDNADYNIRVRGLVDGVKVTTSHVMTLIGTQSMSGKLVIHQGISVVSHEITTLDGLFNGHNLTDARQRAFLLGDPALPVVVRAPVIFKDLVVFRDAARLNPSDPTPVPIFRDFKSFFFDFSLLHNLSVRSQRAMQGRVRQYWGWRVVQEFDSNHERLIPLSLEGISGPVSTTLLPQHHHLALVSSQGNVPVLQREPDVDRYTGSDVTLASRCTTGLVSYISEGRTFIVTSHACLEHITAPVYYAASVHATISESVGTDDDLHVWEVTPQGALLRGAFSVPGALDIQVVWLEQASSTCLVVVEARGTDVLVVCERQAGMFVEHQRLNFTRPSKVSVVQHTPPVGRKHLALAVADPGRTALKGGGIYFFHYDVKSGEFLLIQEELLEDVVWVEFVSRGPDLLLAAVTEDRLGVREGHVCLYKVDWYNPDGLTPLGHRGPLVKSEIPSPRVSGLQHTPQLFAVQELELEDPSEARFLITPSGGLHLYVVGHSGLITWFSQEGIHRFRKEGEVRVANGMTLEVWAMKGKEWTPRISVAGGRCPRGSHQAPNQPTFVLEMIFRGSRNIPAQ